MYNDVCNYLFAKMCQFLRWIDFPEAGWLWLDQNIFNGALLVDEDLLRLAVHLSQMNRKFL